MLHVHLIFPVFHRDMPDAIIQYPDYCFWSSSRLVTETRVASSTLSAVKNRAPRKITFLLRQKRGNLVQVRIAQPRSYYGHESRHPATGRYEREHGTGKIFLLSK
jgi:hypothetical protein